MFYNASRQRFSKLKIIFFSKKIIFSLLNLRTKRFYTIDQIPLNTNDSLF